jgi:phosphoribosylformimino-5-aminoimidazole carboxamide ribotide isomerase
VLIYPAVDIQLGRVARGPAAASANPLTLAARFVAEGAAWLHLVDLDRARSTGRDNDSIVHQITHQVSASVQMGGLLRTAAQARAALALGATRVVAAAAMAPRDLEELVAGAGAACVALGLDVRGGHMVGRTGRETEPDLAASLQRARALGIKTVVYRDLERDGELRGPDLAGARRLAGCCDELVLAGGVASLDDVAAAHQAGVNGLIIGRALLEGRFTVQEAIAWAR